MEAVRYSDQVMPTDYNFTGQRLDSMTGLIYDNARYYDPVSGRFTRADTVQTNTTGMDPYAYVGDNPETWVDPTGLMVAQADSADGSPAVDDPSGLGQLWGDIQDYLNSQNPVVSGVEVDAAVVTAPIWVPFVLGGLLLTIPSDSAIPSNNSNDNQSQNTSVSPTPEATPATNTDGAGARGPTGFRSWQEQYVYNNISTLFPGEAYVKNDRRVDSLGRPTHSKSGGTDIDLETTNKVINIGDAAKFYDFNGVQQKSSIDSFRNGMVKYQLYAASVGKPVVFAYDISRGLAIPTDVQTWLAKRNISVQYFKSK